MADNLCVEIKGWWMPRGEQHLQQHPWQQPQGYQWRQRQRAIEYAQPGWAIDVGAHVGLWARDFCASEKFSVVQCWEPIPVHRRCLEQNVSSAKLRIRTEAVGDREGEVYMQWQQSNTGNTQITRDETDLKVKMTRLDTQEYREPVTLIKIDVEGFEHLVCQGAEQLIRGHRPVVVIEQKPHQGRDQQYLARDLLQSWGLGVIDRHGDDWIMR